MKLTIVVGEDYNGSSTEEMRSDDGSVSLSVYPLCECPEDAILERSLVSCSDVAKYMELAYEAGKRGEDFSVEFVKDTVDE